MSLRRSGLRQMPEEDIDPMASAVNLTDIMLVLAVGFLIFAVMSTGATSISQASQSQSSPAQTTELNEQTTELNEQPEAVTSSGSGYEQKGTVYQDPKTGKMVMVSS
ncbi:DUF2149 domain-containing protein [Methanosphaera cuniculi]|uniref:DUF2149 domain-containing protein n=1 Tax=Methanosphaera cuniculi TaxID=1077256 RepID=A0A2A2HCL4_9EURY|nr:DUF2149 domain-containing protein [Methanosphaera cuniculi]PAV07026.1 hypothetical protein ASJ82_02005 [Methanosphaera cuniculi]PWL08915.1 hypothetical protein MSCUN_01820 [Methanosphaera cuniculi]